MKTRDDTFAAIAAESEREHLKLVERRRNDDLWYDPDPTDAYVFMLECQDIGDGRVGAHTWTELFTSEADAWAGACVAINLRYPTLKDDGWHVAVRYRELVEKRLYKEAAEHVGSFSRTQFRVKVVPVRHGVTP